MHIVFHRTNEDEHELEVVGPGDRVERVRCETRSLLVHDLVHYAVESAAGLSTGFWGALASGRTLASLNDRDAYGGDDLLAIEGLVGPIQGATKASSDPRAIVDGLARGAAARDEQLAAWVSVELVTDVLERLRRLRGHWKATPYGGSMALEWPAPDAPDLERYLARIDHRGPREPTAAVLRDLHRAHMYTVPFESLDVALGRPIHLSTPALFDKIVHTRRGGFCYELNGLFAWLLRRLGFRVTLHQAQVFTGADFGPPFDHLALMVRGAGDWLVDVGFGASFVEPLSITAREEQTDPTGRYRVVQGDDRLLVERREDDAWRALYRVDPTPRVLSEFDEMCRWHSTSPDSHFAGRWMCSRATPEGRITVTKGERFATDEAFADALREHFGFTLRP